MALHVSQRGLAMPASPIRKLMPLADAARKHGVHVFHLNIGQPDLETPACMRAKVRDLRETVYAYTPSAGTPAFLETLRQYYAKQGVDLKTSEILGTTGGSEAIQFAL